MTSIKSIDLQAPSYCKTDSIFRIGKGFIDKVAGFKGGQRGDFEIKPTAVQGRALEIAVPPGATAEQHSVLDALRAYGKALDVIVKIIEVDR